jgi:hypothetical protein
LQSTALPILCLLLLPNYSIPYRKKACISKQAAGNSLLNTAILLQEKLKEKRERKTEESLRNPAVSSLVD